MRAFLLSIFLFASCAVAGCSASRFPNQRVSSPNSHQSDSTTKVYFGGEVGVDHVYAQRIIKMLITMGVPLTYAALSPDALSQDNCDRKLIIITDLGAFTSLAPDIQIDFARRCRDGGSQWLILYSGIQTGEFRGLKVGLESLPAIHPSLTSTLAQNSFLRLPAVDVEPTLPGLCRTTDDAGHGDWEPAMTAQLNGDRKAVAAVTTNPSNGLPPTIVLGCDLYPSTSMDLLLTDLFAQHSPGHSHERVVAIDIDDIFQPNWSDNPAERTVKLQDTDVDYLVGLENRLSAIFDDSFRFNLGFNALWYEQSFGPKGTDDRAGDRALVQQRDRFRWFDHFYAHEPARELTYEALVESMTKNGKWADQHDVTRLMGSYAVSPAHSGTWPPYEPLYRAWQKFGVSAATTFDILAGTKAQRHDGITVMPRLGCGVACFSDHYSNEQLSDAEMRQVVQQEVIPTILANPFVVFMSHQSGYARDHLAGRTFEQAITQLARLTTLTFRNLPAEEIVRRYTDAFGVDVTEPDLCVGLGCRGR